MLLYLQGKLDSIARCDMTATASARQVEEWLRNVVLDRKSFLRKMAPKCCVQAV
jgi:hypothetical protein